MATPIGRPSVLTTVAPQGLACQEPVGGEGGRWQAANQGVGWETCGLRFGNLLDQGEAGRQEVTGGSFKRLLSTDWPDVRGTPR